METLPPGAPLEKGTAIMTGRTALSVTSILRCPVGGSGLSFVDAAGLEVVNARTRSGELRHLTGDRVEMHVDGALASSDGRFIYPVVDGILVLVPQLAIARTQDIQAAGTSRLAPETDTVMRFYDEIGWQPGGDHDSFRDAKLFEDLRPVSREYIHRCHLRVNEYLAPRGKYLLDVASGPLQYREYLTYSHGYELRICADISFTALMAAKQKLGDRGVYVQCDITRLPLKDASVDGFVSLHTVYHVPAGAQVTAFRELERVLKSARTGVVVYTWGSHCLAMALLTLRFPRTRAIPLLLTRALPGVFGAGPERQSSVRTRGEGTGTHPSIDGATVRTPGLYYHNHDYGWFRRNIASRADWRIAVWRSVSVPFMKRYVHPWLFGRPLLSAVFRMENAFPGCLGRIGQYPLMVYRSPSE